jgi:hypothetical protein
MIRARFIKKDGNVLGFEVSGHSGYADEGSDIVCASVSSAVQMAANTITDVIGLTAKVGSDNNLITLRLPKSDSGNKTAAAQAVINGLRLHLSILAEQYEETISIEDSEV